MEARRTGVAASVSASALYGVLFFLPPLLQPLTSGAIYGWRVFLTLVFLSGFFVVTGRGRSLLSAWGRITAGWRTVGAVVVNVGILGVQLWLFGWGPQSGHGLDVALGYLLLPIVMMGTGVVLFRDRFGWLRGGALVFAVVGTACAVFAAGGVSWATAAVAVGYPVYFTLRRRTGLDSVAVLWWEIVLSVPVAVALIVSAGVDAVLTHPTLAVPLLLLGVVSAAALGLYMAASSRLTFTTFGILSYLEPVLLVLVSVLALGEPFTQADVATYAPLAVALLLLGVDAKRLAPAVD